VSTEYLSFEYFKKAIHPEYKLSAMLDEKINKTIAQKTFPVATTFYTRSIFFIGKKVNFTLE
jgi:hypothetical protein